MKNGACQAVRIEEPMRAEPRTKDRLRIARIESTRTDISKAALPR